VERAEADVILALTFEYNVLGHDIIDVRPLFDFFDGIGVETR
jgi:hypothetical protein